MKLVSYNIGYGIGLDGEMDLGRIAAAVDGADIIALQEVERFWPRSGMTDQVKELAKRLEAYWWVFGANIDLHSSETFPGDDADRRRQFGNMVLSRTPILASRNIPLPRCSHLPYTMQRGALEAIVNGSSRTLRIYSTHLCYLSAATRKEQLGAIVDVHRRAGHEGGSWAGEHPDKAVGWLLGDEPKVPHDAVVLGDLNFLPGTAEYTESIDPAATTTPELVDGWRALNRDESVGVTKVGHGRIDYGLFSRDLVGSVTDAWVDSTADGSDHLPLWFELAI